MIDAGKKIRRACYQGLLVTVLGICLLFPLSLSAESFVITRAETAPDQNVVVLDANLRIDLADEVLEALENGVPVTILLSMEVEQLREYVWNKGIASLEQRYVLQYHALSEQYIVRNLNSDEQNTFRSLVSALNTLGEVKNLPLIDRELLDKNEEYQLRLRAEIEINALPSPLRPVAWLSSDWRQGTDWFICKLNF